MKRKQEEFLKQQQEELRQQQLEIQREKEEMERKREALERETAIQLQVWVQMKIGYDWFEQDIFCDRQELILVIYQFGFCLDFIKHLTWNLAYIWTLMNICL